MTDTAIMAAANPALRDYVTDGVPASGEHDPIKSEVRGIFTIIDAALASLGVNGAITVKKATKALLDADLAHAADVLAVVYNDSTSSLNGIYAKVGGSGSGSWEITALALPSAFSSDVAEGNIETALALGYGVDSAFALISERNASSPSEGETAVTYGEVDPANNVKAQFISGSWVEGLPTTQAPFIRERGTVTGVGQTSPYVQEFRAVWNSGTLNSDVVGGVRLTIDTEGTTNFNPGSPFFEANVEGVSRFRATNINDVTVTNAAGTSLGGMILAGNAGEMALTSQIDPNSGLPAQVVRYYWEDSNIGSEADSVAVMRGLGTNRFSIESISALVHIAGNGRFEWEGLIAERLQWVGYEAGSAIGKTIDFNNAGQTPTRASPVVSVSVTNSADDALHICSLSGSTYTTLARFDGLGRLGWNKAPVAAVDTGNGGLQHTPRTVAQLATDFPSPTSGLRAFVSDANATTFYSAVVGGGTNDVPVFYGDGAWRIG